MFIGHFALGFAAKAAAPSVSLGVLFLACQFADLLWPTLVLAGIERVEILPGATAVTPLDFVSYPYSHSLLALCGWGLLVAGAYVAAAHTRLKAGVVLFLLVVSHWVLDVVTHRPDMPVTIGGSTRLGLGLWNSVPATLAVELTIFATGVALYVRTTAARTRAGNGGLLALVLLLLAISIANLFAPPPPSSSAVVWSAQAMWLLVLWGAWIDRRRAAPA
jgi:hypothetical protein